MSYKIPVAVTVRAKTFMSYKIPVAVTVRAKTTFVSKKICFSFFCW